MSRDHCPDEFTHIRKVGRYGFYGLCAFGVAVLAGVLARLIGLAGFAERAAVIVTILVVFMALRDSEKNAEARGRRQA